jgi:hypothetical protein
MSARRAASSGGKEAWDEQPIRGVEDRRVLGRGETGRAYLANRPALDQNVGQIGAARLRIQESTAADDPAAQGWSAWRTARSSSVKPMPARMSRSGAASAGLRRRRGGRGSPIGMPIILNAVFMPCT